VFAIDTNLLVYAHNTDSQWNKKISAFLEKVMNERDEDGYPIVCLPTQVLAEFVNVITRSNLKKPLSIADATNVIKDYLSAGIKIIHQQETQIQTFLQLLGSVTTRKKVFDVVLAATLKDNAISGLYTVNTDDFNDFDFLEVINPLELEE
jgi:predicted nucleic acid-binding protein